MIHGASQEAASAPGGFTLVEVLVALLASWPCWLRWRGRAWTASCAPATAPARRSTARMRLATVLAQWEQDLQAVHDAGVVPALAFDGQTLRLTRARRRRRGAGGLVGARRRVAALGGAGGQTRAAELQQTWLRSQQLLGNEPGHLRLARRRRELAGLLLPRRRLDQRAVHRRPGAGAGAAAPAAAASGAAGAASAPWPRPRAREALPDAVRLVITLDRRHAHARHRRSGRSGS